MSDDTESTHRNPLSSSSSTPSGTQALGVTIEPEREADETAQAGDEGAQAPSGRRDLTQPIADNENDPASQLTANAGDDKRDTATEPSDADDTDTGSSNTSSSEPATELYLSQGEAAGDVISKPNEMAEANDDAVASMQDAFASEEPTASVAQQADPAFDQPTGSQGPDPVEEPHVQAFSGVGSQGEEPFAVFTQMSQHFGSAMKDAQGDAALVGSRMMEFARANFQNNVEMVQNYAAARSLPDLFNAHTTYFKRQMELLNEQASAMRALTTEIASKNARKMQGHDESD